jgi:hypothetical protein
MRFLAGIPHGAEEAVHAQGIGEETPTRYTAVLNMLNSDKFTVHLWDSHMLDSELMGLPLDTLPSTARRLHTVLCGVALCCAVLDSAVLRTHGGGMAWTVSQYLLRKQLAACNAARSYICHL